MQIAIPEKTTARVVIPKSVTYRKCKIFNKLTGKKVKSEIRDGSFALPAGEYRIDLIK
jgi:hypothetical protein